MSSYPPNFNQSYQVSHEQSFKAITNNNNSETTPAGTNHFQDTCACDMYVAHETEISDQFYKEIPREIDHASKFLATSGDF